MFKSIITASIICLLLTLTVFAKDYQKVELNVAMTCKSCQNNIEKALKKTEGIKKVNVDLKGQSVKVEFDGEKITDEKIEQIINDLGYKASIKPKDDAQFMKDDKSSSSSGCKKRCDS